MIRVDKESIKPYVTLAIIAGILYLFFVFVSPLLLPFLLALALAVLIDRPVRWLEGHRIPRPVAISVVLIIVLMVLTVLLVFGLAALTVELAQLSAPSRVDHVDHTTRSRTFNCFSSALLTRFHRTSRTFSGSRARHCCNGCWSGCASSWTWSGTGPSKVSPTCSLSCSSPQSRPT